VLVTEAPAERICAALIAGKNSGGRAIRSLWRGSARIRPASSIRRARAGVRRDACSRTTPYLEQCASLTAWYPFWPGVRYLSILPTNHAIDFMVGFIGPFVCGACVVHLRTLRPEFVRDAFVRYRITYVSLVPMVLKNLERGLRAKFDELKPGKRWMLDRLIGLNKC
jgi:acyl-CoA synthetase (AMP-forming)/AMP-acid ligase II